ncbi:uncharacterized protein LOC135375869 [Ornithodoros turicata]|uniref:uncharacterized protein LOC135375869 n=1 Tax=Ornithodoros turicata TaxID=34597 RepID=UPI003139587A
MCSIVVLLSLGLYAAVDSATPPACQPEAKDQVAWEMAKAIAKDRFYVFQSTVSGSSNCIHMEFNQTDEMNHTGTFLVGNGEKTVATIVIAEGNQFVMVGAEESSCPVLYTDNSTCGVVASPDEEEIVLLVANRTALTASFDTCCKEIFEREAKRKPNPETYRQFSENCLGSS